MTKTLTVPAPKGYLCPHMLIKLTTERGLFSITASIGSEAAGCLHDYILAAKPSLKWMVDLHLSNVKTGAPLHSEENGFHWASKAAGINMRWGPDQNAEECYEIFLKHCRIDCAQSIIDKIAEAFDEGKKQVALSPKVTERCRQHQFQRGVELARKAWKEEHDKLASGWALEAKHGLEKLAALQD